MQAIVRDMLDGFRTAELGVVTRRYTRTSRGGDKNNYECDVRLRDSGLELKRVAIATQRVGAVAIPNVGDLVLVQFLNGDVNAAVVTGRFTTTRPAPPRPRRGRTSTSSQDPDESGVRRLYLELPKSNKLTLEDDKLVLEMGRTAVTVENDGKVEVKTNDQDVTLSDSGGNNMLKLEISPGEVTLKGQTKVVVDAPQIELVSGSTHPLVFGDELLKYLNRIVSTFADPHTPGRDGARQLPRDPDDAGAAAAAGDARPAVAEGQDRMRRDERCPR